MSETLDLKLIRQQHALGYGQCHVDDLIAEVERLRAALSVSQAPEQPKTERLMLLARFGARIAHENLFDVTVNMDGEANVTGHTAIRAEGDPFGFNTCPHGDCAMVRSGVSQAPPQAWQPDWRMLHSARTLAEAVLASKQNVGINITSIAHRLLSQLPSSPESGAK